MFITRQANLSIIHYFIIIFLSWPNEMHIKENFLEEEKLQFHFDKQNKNYLFSKSHCANILRFSKLQVSKYMNEGLYIEDTLRLNLKAPVWNRSIVQRLDSNLCRFFKQIINLKSPCVRISERLLFGPKHAGFALKLWIVKGTACTDSGFPSKLQVLVGLRTCAQPALFHRKISQQKFSFRINYIF